MRNFLNAIIGLPHGEERFGEAEARLEPRTLPIQRNSCSTFALLRPTFPAPGSDYAARRRLSWRSDNTCSRIELGTAKAGVRTVG